MRKTTQVAKLEVEVTGVRGNGEEGLVEEYSKSFDTCKREGRE